LRLYTIIAASIDRPVRPLFLHHRHIRSLSMNLTPTNKSVLETWLVDLSGNIAVSRAGVAFLDGQNPHSESKCLGGQGVDEEPAPTAVRRKSLEAPPKRTATSSSAARSAFYLKR
jgi:hypothetical protein